MVKSDKQTIKDIKKIINKTDESIDTEGLSEEIVSKLLQQLNKGSSPASTSTTIPITAPPIQPFTKLKSSEVKLKTAQMTMKLSKNILILCMMIFILPIICVLITMAGHDMIAILISMMAMIYPAFLFVQSLGMQTYLHKKYGLKPLMKIPQQQQMTPEQQRMIQRVPYGINNQPGQQQKKQDQEMF